MDKTIQFSEQGYIAKRKAKAWCQSLAYYACRIFPVKQNKIVFWTFEGSRGFCCSPKYIAEEIIKRQKVGTADYEMVWLVDDPELEFPQKIKKVKSTLWSRAYHLATSKFWVSNSRTFYEARKRSGQIYIQTWHGTVCIKPIGKYRGDLFPRIAYLVSRHDSEMIDYVLSGSDWCDQKYRDGLVYDGEIIRTSTPRCDLLVNRRNEMHQQIRLEYGVPEHANILLYAPTFRGGSQSTNRSVETEEAAINFEELMEALERRFGGEWYIFLRLHPQLAAKKESCVTGCVSERIMDVTQRQDMNELIAAADAFISDYSSAVFEAAILRMPCLIYADDLEKYIRERGDLFFDMYQLPFPVALTNHELIDNILNFSTEKYEEKLSAFMGQVGIEEDGHASERVVDLIQSQSDQYKKVRD